MYFWVLCITVVTPPSAEFQEELGQLVNEITTKVLIGRPDNINLFIAEYLEDKMKTERQKSRKLFCISLNIPWKLEP